MASKTRTTTGEQPRFAARSDLVAEAHRIASDAHRGQLRKDDGTPYITHPVAVAGLLHDAGFDDDVIAAALLHDVVEDTDMDAEELRDRFGDVVAELVEALSDDEEIEDWAERKLNHRRQVEAAGVEATAIYIADKLSNLRDMRKIYAEEGEAIASRFTPPLDLRVEHWEADRAMAQRVAPDLVYLADFRRELDEFEHQREQRISVGG